MRLVPWLCVLAVGVASAADNPKEPAGVRTRAYAGPIPTGASGPRAAVETHELVHEEFDSGAGPTYRPIWQEPIIDPLRPPQRIRGGIMRADPPAEPEELRVIGEAYRRFWLNDMKLTPDQIKYGILPGPPPKSDGANSRLTWHPSGEIRHLLNLDWLYVVRSVVR